MIFVMLSGVVRCFFFQAEDGIRDAQESRGLGDVYKRQVIFIWTKDEDLVTDKFPEFENLKNILPEGIVLDLSLIHI